MILTCMVMGGSGIRMLSLLFRIIYASTFCPGWGGMSEKWFFFLLVERVAGLAARIVNVQRDFFISEESPTVTHSAKNVASSYSRE